jgi:integrase
VDGGRYGKGVRFDGDGDAVVIPDDPSLEPGAGDFTIEAWVNLFGKLRKKFHRSVRPHLLRHSYAVHMLRGGADVRVLQALFGHESIDDTAKYLRLVKEDVHNTYEEALEGVL